MRDLRNTGSMRRCWRACSSPREVNSPSPTTALILARSEVIVKFARWVSSTSRTRSGWRTKNTCMRPRRKVERSPYSSATPLRKPSGSRAKARAWPMNGRPFGPGGRVSSAGRLLAFLEIAIEPLSRRPELVAQSLQQPGDLELDLGIRVAPDLLAVHGEPLSTHACRGPLHRMQVAAEFGDVARGERRLDLGDKRRIVGDEDADQLVHERWRRAELLEIGERGRVDDRGAAVVVPAH